MSAATPTMPVRARAESPAADVRAGLQRLFFLRRLYKFCALAAFTLASLLLLLLVVGAVDLARPLSRAARGGLVIPVWLSAAALLSYALWPLVKRHKLSAAAREVERATGQHENALVTYAESLEGAGSLAGEPYMMARLEGQARRVLTERLDERVILPRRNAAFGALSLGFMLLVLLALYALAPTAFAREAGRLLWLVGDERSSSKNGSGASGAGADESGAISLDAVRVRVVPPAYSGLGAEEVAGDVPVRALAGSRIEVLLATRGSFEAATLSFGGESHHMRFLGEGLYSGSFIAQASGAFEARLLADSQLAPAPVVRGVEVYPDASPEARITEPASDQLLRGVPSSPVAVRWAARDDLGLAEVVLKYIRSRGEGDAAEFTNGSLPLSSVERASVREWQGGAGLDLARLGMRAGDTLVYWIEARDRNPAANNTGRSVTLAIAIAAPEPVKLNLGDLGPNEIGRFLLSQRMILIQTEKLHRERGRLSREELMKRAQVIAADQREFKNSFNDYIKFEGGGHEEEGGAESTEPEAVEERVREAEDERTGPHMHGIPEPPQGAPSNVRDMVYAIRAMWDAEEALSLADTAKAIVHEREALARLKRAQSAVRYIPPIVARSKPIDLKRRYAGELHEIKTRLEKLARRGADKETQALRAALAEAYSALADLQGTLDVPVTARASAVARAREKARRAADNLAPLGGDRAATIAEATGQLRLVETELARLEMGGSANEYATRLAKPLALLVQAAGNLFAIAEASTRANTGEGNILLPADDARTNEYFRRLNK